MGLKSYLVVTAILFMLVAAVHVARLFLGWTVVIGGWDVPVWVSWLTLIVLVAMATYAVRMLRRLR